VIRLKSLTLQNFRSFYDRTTVEFPENGLLLIRGQSADHGDSSGSGKSSLMLAISYALGICPLPGTSLTSWGAEGPMQVSLVLDLGDAGDVTLNRGKTNNVAYADGRVVTGAKNIEAEIVKLTGLSVEALEAITYRVQGARGTFLSMGDLEKKEFLTGLLGLGVIEKAIEDSEKLLADLEASHSERMASITATAEKLTWLRSQTPPPEVVSTVDHARLAELEKEMAAFIAKGKFLPTPEPSEARRKLEQGAEVLKAKLATLRAADKEAQTRFEAQQRDARNLQAQKRELKNANKQRRLVEVGLQNAKCPTCEQEWHNQEKLHAVQAEIRSANALIDSLPDEGVLEQLVSARFEPNPDIAKWEATGNKLATEYAALKAKEGAEFLAQQQWHLTVGANIERELNDLKDRARSEAFRLKQRDDWMHNHAADIAGLEGKQLFAQTRADDVLKKANAEKDFLALMGRKGFLGVIFDDVLAEIRQEVNAQLGQLANVSQVTLDFVSESVTKAGTTKKAIQPVFYVNGHESSFVMLSGGMQTSVELVVDLALMTVVQRRTGALPGWLMLDEAFNGQGTVTKEAVLSALRVYAEGKLIIVVDHSSETKEQFSQVIEVSNQGGRSSASMLH